MKYTLLLFITLLSVVSPAVAQNNVSDFFDTINTPVQTGSQNSNTSTFGLKLSIEYISDPEIAEEIFLVKDNPYTVLENYAGEDGFRTKIALVFGHIELFYSEEEYSASKNESGEMGTIYFFVETIGCSLYLFNQVNHPFFNMSVGVGKGNALFIVDKEIDGVTVIDHEGLIVREQQTEAGIHLRLSNSFTISLLYTDETFESLTGNTFHNTIKAVTLDYTF